MDQKMLNILKKSILYLNKQKSILFIIISLAIHLLSYQSIKKANVKIKSKTQPQENQINFSIREVIKNKVDTKNKQITETPLEKTKAPKITKFLGKNNHIAKKQQRTKYKPQAKGLDPKKKAASRQRSAKFIAQTSKLDKPNIIADGYISVIKKSLKQIEQQEYNDYINDSLIPTGEFIDLNTMEYKYISYFTKMRKAIELAWEYPLKAARKGWQGKVRLAFVIYKNGYITNIKVLKSSGYSILDRSVIKAIEIASPFPPLPASLASKKLPITGTFNYILGQFARSH
jgi:TonB family protein